jgi:hypothetical protein
MMPERARLYSSRSTFKGGNTIDAPVAEHLTQACFLVRPDDGSRLEVNLEICIDCIVAEVILLQHRILKLVAPFLDILYEVVNTATYTDLSNRLTSMRASLISNACTFSSSSSISSREYSLVVIASKN